MSHHHLADESRDDSLHSVTLTETPAAMSPPQPGSLPAQLASLASESDEWEDEDEEDDEMNLEHDGTMHQHFGDFSRRTAGSQLRASAAEWEDEDEEDGISNHFGSGGSLYRDAQLMRQRTMQEFRKSDRLLAMNPYKLSLTRADLESCIALENAAFPPDLAASREKILYRLAYASALCIGLFTTVEPDSKWTSLSTYAAARQTEAGSERRTVLMGQILVTLTTNTTIKEEDMVVPASLSKADATASGHRVGGRTIALHSLAVLPELQKARVGSTLMRSYIQMVQDAKVADRISLLTYEHLVPWYEKLGFSNLGKSECQYRGKDWYDLVLEFPDEDEESDLS